MRNLIQTAVAAAAIMLAGVATAQTKIGYVDIDKVTNESKPVNDMMSGIQDEVTDLQKEMQAKLDKLRKMRAEVQSAEGVLSEDEVSKKRTEMMRLQNELDELDARGRKKMREMDSTIFEPLMKKILFAIEDVAKERGLDVVLRGEAVLYGASGADITDEVITRLNGSKAGAKTEAKPTTDTKPAPAARAEEKPAAAAPESAAVSEATPAPSPRAEAEPPATLKSSEPVAQETPAASPTPRPTESTPEGQPTIRIRTPKAATPEPDASTGERSTRPVDRQQER